MNGRCTHDDTYIRARKRSDGRTAYECSECVRERAAGRRADVPRVFTGVDGEGVTLPSGEHRYVVLTIGTGNCHPECAPLHRDGAALEWWEVFQHLHRYGTHKEHTHEILIGFYLQYDFTNWVKTLPEERARMLLTTVGQAARRASQGARQRNPVPFPVRDRDPSGQEWEFDVLSKRRFKVRPSGGSWVYVCDTGPFWQTSFLKAINPKSWPTPVCTPEEYETIAEGKANRSTAQFGPEMLEYNATENIVLGRMMGELDKAFQKSRIKLSRTKWFGPGQVAEAWLAMQDVPQFEELRTLIPQDVWKAALSTYYGGWFEIFAHGHVGEAHEYDINSAYPYTIGTLPCLKHGRWTTGIGDPPSGYTIVRAKVGGSHPVVGAMLHRTREGNILRPRNTGGYYWWNEVQASRRAGFVDTIETQAWWHYDPCDCAPPLREIYSLYDRRLQVGKNTPEGKALKLTYNSVYGKTAQTIGLPKWANPVYASLITSSCRTMILDAIATHPAGAAALLMVATDGVYFDTPHPDMDLSDTRIGAWDYTRVPGMTIFQPGLYWSDKTRQQYADDPATVTLKSRGVDPRHLAPHIERLDTEFHTYAQQLDSELDGEWPALTIPIPFAMVSAELALARGKWDTAGVVTTTDNRTISSSPHMKRTHTPTNINGLLRTAPRTYASPFGYVESKPYDKLMALSLRTEELIDPDGPINYGITEQL